MQQIPPATVTRRRRMAYSLIEVMLAGAILAVVVVGAIASFITIRRVTVANNIRTVALFTAQQTLESLRALGADALHGRLVWNGVPENTLENVWELDAVEKGFAQPRLLLRTVYTSNSEGEPVPNDLQSWWMDQVVTVYCEGTEASTDEDIVRVYLDLRWSVAGVEYTDALYTIIE
jgi:type II secretory pathway pseudopilin PulG